MNIETWAYIRHLFLVEKMPKKVIARHLGLDPKTIRKALTMETYSYGCHGPRGSKLDGFKEKIDQIIKEYPGISGVRIYEKIQKMGYTGEISILRDHLKNIRPTPKTFFNIITTPAEEAQVDWAYAGTLGEEADSHRLYCFLMVLSFSRMLFLEFFPSQSLEHFMIGHVHAFHFFSGCPKKIRYDNLRSVVLNRIGSIIQFNPRFLDFAAHYLFAPSPCNVKSPHEKGRVERSVSYVKRNFLQGRTFTSISNCNNQAFAWRDQVANCRIHGVTKQKPIDLFREKEKPYLIILPAIDYDTHILRSVKSTSQALVKFETNRYSIPFAYASRMLTLKADEQLVSIYEKDQLLAQHKRSLEKHQLVENPRHYKGMLSSRPNASYFKYRDTIFAMGDTARLYLENMGKTELNIHHHVKKIMALVELYGKTETLAAMEQAIHYNAFGHEYLANIILSNRRKRSLKHPLGPPSSKVNPQLIRSTWVEERDPIIYDQLFNGDKKDHEDRET